MPMLMRTYADEIQLCSHVHILIFLGQNASYLHLKRAAEGLVFGPE